jgi:hypothetical protein
LGFMAGRDAGRAAGQGSDATLLTLETTEPGTPGEVVASSGGTKYYTPHCPGADRISETNKVWFISAEAAETAGYSAAPNCN